jgi:hypothetical protein
MPGERDAGEVDAGDGGAGDLNQAVEDIGDGL